MGARLNFDTVKAPQRLRGLSRLSPHRNGFRLGFRDVVDRVVVDHRLLVEGQFAIEDTASAVGVDGLGPGADEQGGLQSHRPELLDGVGLIVGIDRFMSEARALTNFSGNAVATLLIGTWTKTVDADRTRRVLDRELPFDEETMVDDHPVDVPALEPKKPVPVQ